jgi:hypothetical protein
LFWITSADVFCSDISDRACYWNGREYGLEINNQLGDRYPDEKWIQEFPLFLQFPKQYIGFRKNCIWKIKFEKLESFARWEDEYSQSKSFRCNPLQNPITPKWILKSIKPNPNGKQTLLSGKRYTKHCLPSEQHLRYINTYIEDEGQIKWQEDYAFAFSEFPSVVSSGEKITINVVGSGSIVGGNPISIGQFNFRVSNGILLSSNLNGYSLNIPMPSGLVKMNYDFTFPGKRTSEDVVKIAAFLINAPGCMVEYVYEKQY